MLTPKLWAEAQTVGEIDSTFDPADLAEFLLASWEGAILRMNVERGPAALDRFKKIVFQTVLKEQKMKIHRGLGPFKGSGLIGTIPNNIR